MVIVQPIGDMFHYGLALHFLSNGRRFLCFNMRVIRPLLFFTIESMFYSLSDWEQNTPTIIALVFSNISCSLWILFVISGKRILNVTNLEITPFPGII